MKTPSTVCPRTGPSHQAAALAAALGVKTLEEYVDRERSRLCERQVSLNGEPARLEKPSPNAIHPTWTVRSAHDSARFVDHVVRIVVGRGGHFITRDERRFASV